MHSQEQATDAVEKPSEAPNPSTRPTSPNEYSPDYVSCPGTTLREMMGERGIGPNALAELLSVSPWWLDGILEGSGQLTPRFALRLEAAGYGTARFWCIREADYRLAKWRRRWNGKKMGKYPYRREEKDDYPPALQAYREQEMKDLEEKE